MAPPCRLSGFHLGRSCVSRRGPDNIAAATPPGKRLRLVFDAVLERRGVAGYVYGISSTFHIYFETDEEAVGRATRRRDLETTDPDKLKGMPGNLIDAYQRQIRHHGLDNMSSTGGVVSSEHTDEDLEEAAAAFDRSISGLLDQGQILPLE